MVKQLSTHVTSFLMKEGVIERDERDLYEYGISKFLEYLLASIVLLILGIVLNKVFETLFFFIAFFPIRTIAGGYHANSRLLCNTISLVVYLSNMLVNSWIYSVNTLSLTFSLIVVSLACVFPFAPVDHRNRPFSQSEYRYKKYLSYKVSIILNLVIIVLQITFGNQSIITAMLQGSLMASVSVMIGKIIRREELKHEKD